MQADSAVTLSLCMILKDEAFFIGRCLDALRDHVDEIVLVDTGSSDDTRDIGGQYTDAIFDFDWVDDFAAARNYSLQQASGDWILVLDADELIEPGHLGYLRQLIGDTDADVFFLDQLNYSDNTIERDWQPQVAEHPYGWSYKGFRANPVARLFRNRADIRFTGTVHEIIDLNDETLVVEQLRVPIHHDMNGNPAKDSHGRQRKYLRIMEQALRRQADGRLAARAGAVRMYELQDYRGAIEHLQLAVELNYDRDCNLEAIAEAWYRLGEHERAVAAYAQLYGSGYATASLCNNYSNLLVKQQDYAAAIEVLERALTLGQPAPQRIARIRHNIDYLRSQLQAVK